MSARSPSSISSVFTIAAFSSSVRNLAYDDEISPPLFLYHASPFALKVFTNSVSESISFLENLAPPFMFYTPNAALVFDSTGKYLEAAACKDGGKVLYLESKAQIGLVGAETLHCLGIGHSLKRKLKLDSLELAEELL